MKDLNPVSTSNFIIGNTAYVIPYWDEFGRCSNSVYPVTILDVKRNKVLTTAIPISLKNTGVSDRRKTFEFKISVRKIYCESSRYEKIAELHGEILSKLTLELQKQRSSSTVLLPSLEYVDAFCKGLNVKQYKIYNK